MLKKKRNPVTINQIPTTCSNKDNADAIIEHIKSTISNVVSGHQEGSHRARTFFTQLAEMLMFEGIHYDQMRDSIVKVVSRYLRETVFTPFNILREMDLAGGKLSYAGLEVLRRCETKGVKGVHTIIPSSAAMREIAAWVERFADTIVPFRMIRNKKDGAEGFYFRSADMLTRVLETRDMIENEALEENKTCSLSLDGARLTNNVNHTLGGYKFNDPSNPLKQSHLSVHPLVCTIGSEKKKHSQGLYAMMYKESKEAGEIVLPSEFGIKKVRSPFDSDMSCDWKMSDKGGAAKNATFPCSKCNVMSAHLITPNGDKENCKWCIELGFSDREDWDCYHHPICSNEFINSKSEEINEFRRDMPTVSKELQQIWSKSKITINKNDDPRLPPTPDDRNSVTSIHFDVESSTNEKRRVYSNNLTDNLSERKLPINGSLLDRQDRLKRQQIREWTYMDAFSCVQRFGPASLTPGIVMVMDSIPCILHMEMRMGIRIITLLMKVGLMNAKNNRLSWIPRSYRGSIKEKCDASRGRINRALNKKILGNDDMAFQYDLPYDEKLYSITECNMKNGQVRKTIASINLLIEICVVKRVNKDRWKTSMAHYSAGMDIVKMKGDLSNAQINDFQRHIDLWFQDWVILFGDEGVTN